MTRRAAAPETDLETPVEPPVEVPLPTTAGAWRVENGQLVLEDPPTQPAPLSRTEET